MYKKSSWGESHSCAKFSSNKQCMFCDLNEELNSVGLEVVPPDVAGIDSFFQGRKWLVRSTGEPWRSAFLSLTPSEGEVKKVFHTLVQARGRRGRTE